MGDDCRQDGLDLWGFAGDGQIRKNMNPKSGTKCRDGSEATKMNLVMVECQ